MHNVLFDKTSQRYYRRNCIKKTTIMKQKQLNFRLMAVLLGLVMCNGCQSIPSTLKAAKLTSPNNIYEFDTRTTTELGVPNEVLKRAAATTHRRGYRYFTLTQTSSKTETNNRPTIGFNYGRDPFGFSDAGDSTLGGLSMDIPLSAHRIHWIVTMMNSEEAGHTKQYDVTSIPIR